MLFVYEQVCMRYNRLVNGPEPSGQRVVTHRSAFAAPDNLTRNALQFDRSGRSLQGVFMSKPEPSQSIADLAAGEARAEGTDYALDGQIGFIIRRAHQRATAIFQEHFPDLTPTQWAVLSKLHETGPLSQNLVGRMTAMDAATMQGVVRRLMERHLVTRTSDPNDRRRLTLCLTDTGKAAVLGNTDKAFAVSRETLSPLSPRERETLLKLLLRLT
jgi:MarR family transcriptional regulator, lower aerobic nicotinate degradation pathway regulator